MNKLASVLRNVASIVVAYIAFNVANSFYYYKTGVSCADCFFHYGVPFAYFNEGGFGGGGGYIWSGVLADGLLIVGSGVVVALTWKRLVKRFPKQPDYSKH